MQPLIDESSLAAARQHAESMPLDEIDVSQYQLFANDTHWPYFARLRREDPVHWCRDSRQGPYWSITRHQDIMDVDSDHQRFSADTNITLFDQAEDFTLPMFIAMDPPQHDAQRMAVAPAVAPRNLANLEATIRQRAGAILDALPIGEPFDWVQRVSIELTTQMLATLLDFPLAQRRQLIHWSDLFSSGTIDGEPAGREARRRELLSCLAHFTTVWHEKAAQPPGADLVSMLAHSAATRNLIDRPLEFLGNIMLLITGGNDTTRNTISGGVLALNQFPDEYAKLRAEPTLIPNMVAEMIRWQTPVAHIRRTALADTEFGGKRIRRGDKVVMWYVSGNRDDAVFEAPHTLRIDRKNARQHVSFGYGIHRCMGNRLAEMQLRVLWEEILPRFARIDVLAPPVRARSNLLRGIQRLAVRVHAH